MNRESTDPTKQPEDRALLAFFRAIAAGDLAEVSRTVDSTPAVAVTPIRVAASRKDPHTSFLDNIRHYIYGGDTALHVAAASYQRPTAALLIANRARVRARNRRGAEPIHYAADGIPDGAHWDPAAQHSIIEYLIANGADPNACDNSGVAALHRAVRTRCSSAVRALLDNGASPRLMNKRGSTPLHLAVHNTGRGDSGTIAAKDHQGQIIELLLRHGAKPTDTGAKGKTVVEAATNGWIRALLSCARAPRDKLRAHGKLRARHDLPARSGGRRRDGSALLEHRWNDRRSYHGAARLLSVH